MILTLTAFAVGLFFFSKLEPKKQLRVYAYSSFAKPWSAGPQIAREFEAKYNIPVEIIDAGDSALLLQKMKIDPLPVDLVIGLDQDSLTAENLKLGWLNPNLGRRITWLERLPTKYIRGDLIPFDWSPLTFIFRSGKTKPPKNWDDLLDKRFQKSITMPDPRTSNLGWQFLKWIITDKGESNALAYLKLFREQIFSAPPSWSSSYGLFQAGQSQMAFSYVTSLLYHHWEERKPDDFAAVAFTTGHPVQVEYVGVPKVCKNCDYAREFISFLLLPATQGILLKKNFMLPVVDGVTVDTSALPNLAIKTEVSEISVETKKRFLDEWVKLW